MIRITNIAMIQAGAFLERWGKRTGAVGDVPRNVDRVDEDGLDDCVLVGCTLANSLVGCEERQVRLFVDLITTE